MKPNINPASAPGATVLAAHTAPPFRIGHWTVDIAARELSDGATTRRTSPRALAVLLILAHADGGVVSRSSLMDAVWPDTHVGEESLTQAVAELRRLLGQAGGDETQYVVTVQKSGYRLVVPVVWDVPPKPAPLCARSEVELPLRAHLAVSQARNLRWMHGYSAIGEIKALMDEARAAAPHSSCVHAEYAVLVGCTILHQGDSEIRIAAARDAAQRAVALRPDSGKAHCAVGFTSASDGQLDIVTQAFQRAFAIEPYNAEIHSLAAQAFFGLGALDTALILAERAATLDTDDILPPYVAARAAAALGQKERAEIAARMCLVRADARLMLIPGSVRASSVRAAALAMLNRADEALLETDRVGSAPDFRDMIALTEIGALDAALDHLEALLDRGWHARGWLGRDPMFAALKASPRSKKLAGHFLAA